jgi:hypothetical protein
MSISSLCSLVSCSKYTDNIPQSIDDLNLGSKTLLYNYNIIDSSGNYASEYLTFKSINTIVNDPLGIKMSGASARIDLSVVVGALSNTSITDIRNKTMIYDLYGEGTITDPSLVTYYGFGHDASGNGGYVIQNNSGGQVYVRDATNWNTLNTIYTINSTKFVSYPSTGRKYTWIISINSLGEIRFTYQYNGDIKFIDDGTIIQILEKPIITSSNNYWIQLRAQDLVYLSNIRVYDGALLFQPV